MSISKSTIIAGIVAGLAASALSAPTRIPAAMTKENAAPVQSQQNYVSQEQVPLAVPDYHEHAHVNDHYHEQDGQVAEYGQAPAPRLQKRLIPLAIAAGAGAIGLIGAAGAAYGYDQNRNRIHNAQFGGAGGWAGLSFGYSGNAGPYAGGGQIYGAPAPIPAFGGGYPGMYGY